LAEAEGGLHPKMAKLMEDDIFMPVERYGYEISKERSRKGIARTWKDSNKFTMFMD
jgi:hypothetical protein